MNLKDIPQHQENWEEPFGMQVGSRSSYLYWDEFSEPKAANRSSFGYEGRHFSSSVSLDPLPSFLTKTPLGVPCDEAVEVNSRMSTSVQGRQKVRSSSASSQSQVVEQRREVPRRLRQKTGQQRKSVKSSQRVRTYGFIYRWIYEEVRISMSKMSIASLVLGLLFLGTLFFIIGFLAAVSTISSSTSGEGTSSPVWQASNTQDDKKGAGKGLGRVVNNIGGGIVGKVVGHQIGALGKVVGTSSVVPKSLQPFARYGMGKVRGEIREDIRQVNPFVSHRRKRSPAGEQQFYGSQQPGGEQQYPSPYSSQGISPQGQVYGPPSMAVGYQQPAAISQGGYSQSYAPPQQQMMQPSYYPQPMQQQAYQQPATQPMVPQQQMIPGQQYQQPVPPPQGYYR